MNKDISKSPTKQDFLLNLAKSPPLSINQFDYLSPQSKDSVGDEEDDQISLHHDRFATVADPLFSKNPPAAGYASRGKRPNSKKKSVEYQKDPVALLLSTPASTTNAKAVNKSSHSRPISRSNTAHHLNFLNSKEFAKFALSKVLPRETKKEKGLHKERSPKQKRSQTGSLEKSPPKPYLKEGYLTNQKLNALQSKKQKVKLRASNLTYNDFSSVVDQTRHIHSFMNSPQKKSNIQMSIHPTKSTSNLRPMSTKNAVNPTKNAWLQASNEAFRRLESTSNCRKQQNTISNEEARSKERNKGMQSIASILNLRRDKKVSPEKNTSSCYPNSHYHRKVASIGSGAQNNTGFNHSVSHQTMQASTAQTTSLHDDHKGLVQRSPSQGKKISTSPLRREASSGKRGDEETVRGSNAEQFASLKQAFDYLLEKYRCDVQNVQETYTILKQIKQAYEALITGLLMNNNEGGQGSLHEKELKSRCEALAQEKVMLEEELKYLRAENQRLYSLVSSNGEKEEGNREYSGKQEGSGNKRSTKGGAVEGGGEVVTNPPTQKLSSTSSTENLKQIIMSQQEYINALQNKEAKLMQLLYTIHKRGFDVEKLLNEEVNKSMERGEYTPNSRSRRGGAEQSEGNESKEVSVASSGVEICSLMTSRDLSDIIPNYKELGARFGIPDSKMEDLAAAYQQANNNMDGFLKDKLKLDFRGLPNNHRGLHLGQLSQNAEQQPDSAADPLGFHEEFMSKIEEFSLSWRQEALNQRNM